MKILEIFILAMLWGPSFLFTKIAVLDLEPISLVTLRVTIGCLLLFIVLRFRKLKLPHRKDLWFHAFILSFFVHAIPFSCFGYALKYIPSSLAALINGTTPIMTVLLAHYWLDDEKFTRKKILGISLGLSAFLILFLPQLVLKKSESPLHVWGVSLAFFASSLYAVGMVYARKFVHQSPPLAIPIMQLFSSLFYLLPVALLFEHTWQKTTDIQLESWLSVLGLGLFGTALAYTMYYSIIAKYGATALSSVTYLLPILGACWGVFVLDETLDFRFYSAAALILTGVFLVNSNKKTKD
ncbi:MAG: DMT family transporter [Gammaproteobacteria bacterium]